MHGKQPEHVRGWRWWTGNAGSTTTSNGKVGAGGWYPGAECHAGVDNYNWPADAGAPSGERALVRTGSAGISAGM
jgi:hypothetical protein